VFFFFFLIFEINLLLNSVFIALCSPEEEGN